MPDAFNRFGSRAMAFSVRRVSYRYNIYELYTRNSKAAETRFHRKYTRIVDENTQKKSGEALQHKTTIFL